MLNELDGSYSSYAGRVGSEGQLCPVYFNGSGAGQGSPAHLTPLLRRVGMDMYVHVGRTVNKQVVAWQNAGAQTNAPVLLAC